MSAATKETSPKLPGLDWLNFFVADVQTGFGPFIAVYLTEQKWTQGDIGLALSVGTVTAMISQIPAGALVDMISGKRVAAAMAIAAISLSAVLLASSPAKLPVLIAEVLHGFASCMLSPAIAALTLALVGQRWLSQRLGVNARWASMGNGLAAAAMGAIGDFISSESVFWLTAALGVPSLLALRALPAAKLPTPQPTAETRRPQRRSLRSVLGNYALLVFAGCLLLFQLSNAAVLNLAAGEATASMADGVQLVIAACIIMPQIVVVVVSPWVGRAADRWGRRPLLLLGLVVLPIRAVLFALVANPYLLIPIQVFDGVSAAVIGVMLPLIAADIAGDSGRYNLCIGVLGFASGIGATLSTSMAGFVADAFSSEIAFLVLAGAGICAVLLAWGAMPDTRAPGPAPARPDKRRGRAGA